MKLLRGFEEPAAYRGGYVSIGNFDGVHRGHQAIVRLLVERARSEGVPAVVFTFDPHPIRILRPDEAPPRLTTTESKAELLGRYGVDFVIAYPADRELLSLAPEEFFERIVRKRLAARGLVEGPNFYFGRGRSGTIETLRSLCEAAELDLDIALPLRSGDGDRIVSSSAIRELIATGDLKAAVEALGHPYRIAGRIVSGAGRGRTLGFPTANLADVTTLLPAGGVYAGRCSIDGVDLSAAVHIGPNPTFKETERKIECHLLDFAGDLPGDTLAVDLLARIRETRTFGNAAELREQLAADCEIVRGLAGA